jgi:hypothetical protein
VEKTVKELKLPKTSFPDAVKNEQINQRILENMIAFGKEHGLNSLEQVLFGVT